MPIDITNEHPVWPREFCRRPEFRNRRNNKDAHVAKFYRCINPGARGPNGERIRLEVARVPGGVCTSAEAIERFLARLNGVEVPIVTPSPRQRQKQIDQAERELASAGFEVGGKD